MLSPKDGHNGGLVGHQRHLDKCLPTGHHSLTLYQFRGTYVMATYACNKCGMAVNTSCAKCDVALVDDSLELGNGNKVQIAKCPSCEGKIKSPSCCGEEMACSI